MYNYEIMLIVKSSLNESELIKIKKIITDILTTDANINDWGVRELAYEIQHDKKGHYLLVSAKAEPKQVKELQDKVNLNKEFIRFMAVNLDREIGYETKFAVTSPDETKWIEREKRMPNKNFSRNSYNHKSNNLKK